MANDTNVRSTGEGLIVTIDGILQDGPWATTPCYTVTGNNQLFFTDPPAAGTVVQAFYIATTIGVDCDDDFAFVDSFPYARLDGSPRRCRSRN